MSPGMLVRAVVYVSDHDGDDRAEVLRSSLIDILAAVADFSDVADASASDLIEALRPTVEILAGD